MKVFAYHNSYNGVSAYRVWNPAKALKAAGHTVKMLPKNIVRVDLPLEGKGNIPGIESHTAITDWADIIFSNFRTTYFDTVRLEAQSRIKPLVIDIDDDVINLPRWFPTYQQWQGHEDLLQDPSKMSEDAIRAAQMQGWGLVDHKGSKVLLLPGGKGIDRLKAQFAAARCLTVSTERLKQVYSGLCKRIEVIPNGIDPEQWGENVKKDDGFIRMGLFGGNSHAQDWAEAWDSIKRLLDEFPKLKLVVNGWITLDEETNGRSFLECKRHFQFSEGMHKAGLVEHPRVEIHEPCEIESYPQWLAQMGCDLALAPLRDDTFNRAKSNIKYLEFGILGIPAVYGDVEPYKCVTNGETGFLAGSPLDYYKYAKRLIESEVLRKEMGGAARKHVLECYTTDKAGTKLAKLFTEIQEEWNHEKAASGLLAAV